MQHILILICTVFFAIAGAESTRENLIDSTQQRFIPSGSSIALGDLVSSSLVNIELDPGPGVLDLRCMAECTKLGCAAVKMSLTAGLCQLLLLHVASKQAGDELAGTFGRRVVSLESGWRLWKTIDFEDQLKLSTLPNPLVLRPSPGNGSIGTFLVPIKACYRIEARGARGGSTYPGRNLFTGGSGALIAGTFNFTAGTKLIIVVGRRGGDVSEDKDYSGSGGGGGSFVYLKGATMPLLAAGGGGGGATEFNGKAGENGTSGGMSVSELGSQGLGGSNGQPGYVKIDDGNCGGLGAGWFGKSNASRTVWDGGHGGSRQDGWIGGSGGQSNPGAFGGFGGGGGGAQFPGGSGGGGGFSGGGAGYGGACTGGGGGSYCGGSDCVGVTGGNVDEEHGSVAMEILLGIACV